MKRPSVIGMLGIVLATGLLLTGAAGEPFTVGEFLQVLAGAKNLPADTPAAADASLRSAGIRLPELSRNQPLTEGHVAEIARALGINVTTSSPAASFDREQVGTFVNAFVAQIELDPSGLDERPEPEKSGKGADPLTKGKGKKKGLKRTPMDPV